MTVLAREESTSFLRMPSKSLRCMSYEDTLREMEAFLDGKLDKPQSTNDVYADITEPMASNVIRQPKSEDPDATDYSSSFGDTTSRSENLSGPSDAEVESEYRVDNGLASTVDRYNSVFPMRKKKLTSHWRNFIHPLMWRCKWAELKIRELESQALKYSREYELNEQTKLLELPQCDSEFCSKSIPFFNRSGKRRLMKRRKRKPVENMTDISSYMSNHQIFSYLENKKIDFDGTPAVDDDANQDSHPENDGFCMDYDWLRDGEDSLEQILRQIETVQYRVQNLRSQLDEVMLKNGVKFSSYENLSLLAPYDGQTSDGDNMSIDIGSPPNLLEDFDISDLVLPESIISSYGDGVQIPDIIESTVGLLSAKEVTLHQPQLLESGDNILGDTLIPKMEMLDEHVSSVGNDHPLEENHSLENEDKNIISLQVSVIRDSVDQDKSTLKSCSTLEVQAPKNKRKRGERKAGPGAWIISSAGEPDSS